MSTTRSFGGELSHECNLPSQVLRIEYEDAKYKARQQQYTNEVGTAASA